MVINMLNMAAHDALQLESFGEYSEEINDYTERGLQQKMFTDEGASLRAIVDPIAYRNQLKQPKLIILATNDAYWPVDALNLYWNDLQGDKYLLYVPNNGHGIKDYPRVVATIAALQQSLTGGKPLPKLAWRQDGAAGTNSVGVDVRRLRLRPSGSGRPRQTLGIFARQFGNLRPLPPPAKTAASLPPTVPKPESGFAATFLEAEFPGEPMPFVLTTTLHVIGNDAKNAAVGGNGAK